MQTLVFLSMCLDLGGNVGFFCRGILRLSGIIFNRSFSRDVIAFLNLKLKIYQSFYPHQVKEGAYLYLFAIFQRNSLLRLETRAF